MPKFIFSSCLMVIFFCNIATAASILLPQTGQTSCYDASGNVINCLNTLQDGALKAGVPWPSPRFVDNSNGTVADKLTNLLWSKDADAPEFSTCSVPQVMNWQQALDYIGCLNSTNYLGVNDWALPNTNQMRSLLNLQNANNAPWLTTAGFVSVQNGNYWTNDTYVGNPANAWSVSFNDGRTVDEDKLIVQDHVWPVRIAPDLIVTNIDAPSTVVSGDTMTITVTIKNIGCSTKELKDFFYAIAVYLSTDSTITSNDTYFTGVSFGSLTLQSGQEYTYNFTTTMPQMTGGTYYFGAIVDKNNMVREVDETNNFSLAAPVTTVIYSPDLVITNVGVPTNLVTGETTTIPVTIKNIGTKTVIPYLFSPLYLSTDNNITVSDTQFSAVNYGNLTFAAGEERTFTLTFQMPPVPSGTYYVGAIADSQNLVPETNEANNSYLAPATTTVSYGPDLVVTMPNPPPTGVIGQPITIPVTLKNIGTGATPSANISWKFYVSTDANITSSDPQIFLQTYWWVALNPGESMIKNFTTYMIGLTPGTYYFGAIADTSSSVFESDEANNVFMAPTPIVITN